MTLSAYYVNKFTYFSLLAALGCLLALGPGPARAGDAYQVTPVQSADDLRLLPASGWPPPESGQGEMLLKLSYLRGILDALQYVEVAPSTAAQVPRALAGRSLQELAAAIDRYYLADPRRRELPPAAVLFRVLPGGMDAPEPSPMPRGTVKPPPRDRGQP